MAFSPTSPKRIIRVALLTAVLGLTIAIPPMLWSQYVRLQEGRWVSHTWAVLAHLQKLESQFLKIQSGNKSEAEVNRVKKSIAQIGYLTSDNQNQQTRLSELQTVFDLELLNPYADNRKRDQQIQKLLADAINEETQLLQIREQKRERAIQQLIRFQLVSLATIVVTFIVIIRLYHRNYLLVQQQAQAIASLAHDARTPITAIQSSIDILSQFPDRRHHYIKIQWLCRFLVDMLEDVRFFTQPKISCDIEPVDVVEFCHFIVTCVNAVYLDSPTTKIQLITPPRLFANLDRDLLRRTLYNLLVNAINYSAPDPRPVEFTVEQRQFNQLLFRIADRGRGIPEKDRKDLFKPYRRGSNTSGTRGTGLGLAIAKRSVEACKGRIWFEDREGGGTIFYLELPTESLKLPNP